MSFEVNFDGLVGPTHNYSGLSHGNVASTSNRALESNPLDAVLQGLQKAKALVDLGLKQALLPPQERPDIEALRRLGFSGTPQKILKDAADQAPELLSAVASASSMWTANAATVSPSADTADGKVHFTPANLVTKFHRSLEPETTSRALRAIFLGDTHFRHHDPLPSNPQLGDEGAANHTRLSSEHGKRGIEFFVYGRSAFGQNLPAPQRFPARQTLEASRSVARLHQLDPSAVVFGQQHPDAIDAGVFHNDVAGVGNQSVYFYHEQALLDSEKVMRELSEKFKAVCGGKLTQICVPASFVSMADAVKSYLFNSQLLTLPNGKMVLILPQESQTTPAVAAYVEKLRQEQKEILQSVLFFDLKQSMRNGGGPACLRLRVILNEKEIAAVNPRVFLDAALFDTLTSWAKKNYRDRLVVADLADEKLLNESRTALDELTQILNLGSIYSFQRAGQPASQSEGQAAKQANRSQGSEKS